MDEEIERLVVSVRADTQGFARDSVNILLIFLIELIDFGMLIL